MTGWPELVDRARRLVQRGPRSVLGIVGGPASGKSSVARGLAHELGPSAVVVSMDGFHYAQAQLMRLGRVERKGAPDTFDAHGYVNLLHRLRENAETVYAPEFRRRAFGADQRNAELIAPTARRADLVISALELPGRPRSGDWSTMDRDPRGRGIECSAR